jgi:hypothetical protein
MIRIRVNDCAAGILFLSISRASVFKPLHSGFCRPHPHRGMEQPLPQHRATFKYNPYATCQPSSEWWTLSRCDRVCRQSRHLEALAVIWRSIHHESPALPKTVMDCDGKAKRRHRFRTREGQTWFRLIAIFPKRHGATPACL